MNYPYKFSLLVTVGIFMLSCNGSKTIVDNNLRIKPNDELINVQLPDDYNERVFFKKTAIVRRELDAFVGSLIAIDSTDKADIIMLPSFARYSSRSSTTPIDDGILYQSKITGKWSAGSKFKSLFNLDLDFSNNQAYEMIIQDVSYSTMNKDSINWRRVLDFTKLDKPKDVKCRCLVLNAYLSTILYKGFKEVDAKTNIAIGDVFQANGITYNSQINKSIKDYRVSFWCFDIDKASQYLKSNNAFSDDSEEKKKESVIFIKTLATGDAAKKFITGGIINDIKK